MNEEIVLCGGKYKFYIDELNDLRCLRNGENWWDFIGDNAVLALFRECLERNEKLTVTGNTLAFYRRGNPNDSALQG